MKDNHIDKTKLHVCIICAETIKPKFLGLDKECNKHYWYDGNNAEPIAKGKCCDKCNIGVVIPHRFTDLQMSIIERKLI